METQTGLSFFKEDIILKSGKQSVIFRVASLNEDVLKDYLSAYEFSLEQLTFADMKKRVHTPPVGEDLQTDYINEKVDYSKETIDKTAIFTETVLLNQDIKNLGFRINHVPKNSNARLKSTWPDWTYTAYHESQTWPEWFVISSHSGQIAYEIDRKNRWYMGYYTGNYCEYEYPYACKSYWDQENYTERTFWVDGPYKCRAKVGYHSYAHYSFEWWT